MFNSLSSVILFLASGTSAVVGNALLKAGINHLKGFEFSLPSFTAAATNWQIISGFLLYGASSVLYLKLLSSVDVTKAYPALIAYMAIVILLLGAFFLKEPLTLVKLLGVLLIVCGIFVINH